MERIHFQDELEDLKMLVFKMAGAAFSAVNRAVEAYMEKNIELAKTVIAGDTEINCMDIGIDKRALRLLALEQPMAGDLRMIVGAMKISNELERIADQAVNIAHRLIDIVERPLLPPIAAMEKLIDTSLAMLEKSISAMKEMDVDLAMKVVKMDDRADEYTLNVLKEIIGLVVADAPDKLRRRHRMEDAIQKVIISRCLERISDLSTNICEHVAFISKGVYIKHSGIDCDRS